MKFEGFQRMVCIAQPLRHSSEYFDLDDFKGIQQHLRHGWGSIYGSANHRFDHDAFYNENEYGAIGISTDGAVMLNTALIINENESSLLPVQRVIKNLYEFLMVTLSAYKSIEYFGGVGILFTLNGIQNCALIATGNRPPHSSKPCPHLEIQAFESYQLTSLESDERIQEIIARFTIKVVGCFNLPPMFAKEGVSRMSQRNWNYS